MKKISLRLSDAFTMSFFFGLMAFNVLVPEAAHAALPWEGPLEELMDSLTGPVARAACAIVVCVSGVMVALGEGGQFGRLVGRMVFGLSLAVGFMQILSMF